MTAFGSWTVVVSPGVIVASQDQSMLLQHTNQKTRRLEGELS